MSIQNHTAVNNGVGIHYLLGDEGINPTMTTLLHIPGSMNGAETFVPEFPNFAPRKCIVMSQRGRGRSDAPEEGYSFENLVSDVEAVVEHAKLDSLFIFAFSLGVPIALGFAVKHPEKVKGIVVGDYPAKHPALSAEWVEKYKNFPPGLFNMMAVEGIQRESREVLLWEQLQRITCPVLVLQGGRADVQPPAILKMEEAELYKQYLKEVKVEVFAESGHLLWEPSHEKLISTIQNFLDEVDR